MDGLDRIGNDTTEKGVRSASGPSSIILLQSAVPFILAGGTAGGGSNQFTMGDNGALSTLATLPTTYLLGGWIYMPAGAIFTAGAGSAAGLYWFVGSSTTAGQVYNNRYTSDNPAPPAVLVAFVTTGPGVVTQTVGANIDMVSITVPGGSIGPNGALTTDDLCTCTNNANVKSLRLDYGGMVMSTSMTNWAGRRIMRSCRAMGRADAFKITNGSVAVTEGTVASYAANFPLMDSGLAQTYKITLNMATASDMMVLEFCTLTAAYGA